MTSTVQIRIARIINIALAVILFFLGMRFLFRLLAANPQTPFVSWIYGVSDALIAPFRGIVQNPTLANGALVDIVTIIAMMAYVIGAYLLISIVAAITRSFSNGDRYHRHSHA